MLPLSTLLCDNGSKVPYHHGDLRNALLDAAGKLLQSQDDISLRAVSEEVGVSHAAAYRHFRNKANLLAAVSERGFVRLRDRLSAAKQKTSAGLPAQLEAMCAGYVAFAQEEPSTYHLMFGPKFLEQLSDAGVSESARECFAELLTTVIAGQQSGDLKPGSPFLISQAIWSLLHGLSLFYLDGQLEPQPGKTIAPDCWRFLFQGIGARECNTLTNDSTVE